MDEVWSAKRDFQFALSEWGTDYLDPDSNAKGIAHSDRLGEDASIQALGWWAIWKARNWWNRQCGKYTLDKCFYSLVR